MNKPDETVNTQKSCGPKSFWGFLSVILICATAVFIAYQVVPSKKPQPIRRLWTPLVVNTDGKEMITPDTLRMEFWTPSSRTKDYLAKDGTNRTWEFLESEEAVMEFGKVLRTNSEIVAYRRMEVWGHGRSSLKPGWWWSITVRTNYQVSSLSRLYRGYWKMPGGLFVEVIDNRGHEEP